MAFELPLYGEIPEENLSEWDITVRDHSEG